MEEVHLIGGEGSEEQLSWQQRLCSYDGAGYTIIVLISVVLLKDSLSYFFLAPDSVLEINPDYYTPGQDNAKIWAETPIQAKGAAMTWQGRQGSWVLMTLMLLFFQPRCIRAILKSWCVCFAFYGVIWYGPMMSITGQPASVFAQNESVIEVPMAFITGYLGFIAPVNTQPIQETTIKEPATGIRISLLVYLVVISGMLVKCMFFTPSDVVGYLNWTFMQSGQDTQEVWENTPMPVKCFAMVGIGWYLQHIILIVCVILFEDNSDKAICKSLACIMLWWQLVWYGSILGRVDADGTEQIPVSAYAMTQSTWQVPLIFIFGALGW